MLQSELSAGECGPIQPHSTRTPTQIRESEMKKSIEVRVSAGQSNRISPVLRRFSTESKSNCDLFLGPLYIENVKFIFVSFLVLRNSENYF